MATPTHKNRKVQRNSLLPFLQKLLLVGALVLVLRSIFFVPVFKNDLIPSPASLNLPPAELLGYRSTVTNYVHSFCYPETSLPASTALFERLIKEVGADQISVTRSAMGMISEYEGEGKFKGDLHATNLSPEDKRIFLAKASQTYCPSDTGDDPVCQVLSKVLPQFDIPEDVHAMSRGGEGYVSGGFYNADMVLEAVQMVSPKLNVASMRVLDFGGSSGRSMTTMKASFPLMQAHVADPIRKSIEWMDLNVPNVKGYSSPINPPTHYEEDSFDLIFAISIWSHYNFDNAALVWLDEMYRIIDKANGMLVITTHGWRASQSKTTDAATSKLCMKAMESVGTFYVAAFPNNIDWDADTKNPDWGMSWVNPTWLKKKLSKKWTIELVLPARSDCLQDVILLRPVQ